MITQTNTTKQDLGRLLLRLETGGLLLFHGIYKLLHGHDYIRYLLLIHGWPKALAYGVPIGEVLCPILVIAGVFSRYASLIISFYHAPEHLPGL